MEKEIIAELEEEQELEAVIELEKLRGAQGYNTYELYLRNLSKDEIPMTEKEWLNSLSKTNYYKVYTQRYVDDYNRVTKYIPLKINSYNETCLISVAINGFHLLKDKDYQLLDYGELANKDSEYKYDLNENLRYISLNEPLYTMNHQQIDIEVYKTIVANSEDYEKLKGEGGGANGLTYENNLLQLTENGTPVGESVQIDSNSIFICGENQTIDDAPTEAKIIIDSNIVNAKPSEIVNSMEGNEIDKGPSVNAVKNYVNNRTIGIQYIPTSQTSQTFTPSFDCYAEIYYSISGWAYGGAEIKPTVTCTQGNAELIADLPNGTRGHDTTPDGVFTMKVFKLNKGIEYKFSFSGMTGGTIASGSLIKLIPRYEEVSE